MKPFKKWYSPHMLRTEVETFDEAVDVWRQQQRRIKQSKGRKLNLKQELGLARGRADMKSVTLSDRVVKGRQLAVPSRIKPAVIWTKAQVIEAFKTGSFKPAELAARAKVSAHQIKHWFWPNYKPDHWYCCGKVLSGGKPECPRCGTHWKKRYNIEEL